MPETAGLDPMPIEATRIGFHQALLAFRESPASAISNHIPQQFWQKLRGQKIVKIRQLQMTVYFCKEIHILEDSGEFHFVFLIIFSHCCAYKGIIWQTVPSSSEAHFN